MLCVLPKYQGMKIGGALLEWGMRQADAMNARIYLEATVDGLPAYLRYGWEVVQEIMLDFTRYGGVGSQKFALMIRQPRGQK